MTVHSRTNPFFASIKERYSLNKAGSKKRTVHISLDVGGSDLSFSSGDSIGIFPVNSSELVEKTIAALGFTGEEAITEKRSGEKTTVRAYFSRKANVGQVSQRFLQELKERQTNFEKKEFLETLFSEGTKESLKGHLAARELWDLLEENREVVWNPQELCDLLKPLLPRLYSIASSPKVVQDEVHLTVASLQYETNGQQRKGVCTHFLCDLVPLEKPVVPVYIQKNPHFALPSDPAAPIIMVGPGTGIAPFRAFMQERISEGGQGKNWLFFGEWNAKCDFFYDEFWRELQEKKQLELDCAFSRDQSQKVYVQHKMREKGAQLYSWLEEGAHLYVCGNADRMAKDVEKALVEILQENGQMSEQQAKERIKQLRKEKRYVKDVY